MEEEDSSRTSLRAAGRDSFAENKPNGPSGRTSYVISDPLGTTAWGPVTISSQAAVP